jgi:hypothetical protein
LEAFPIDRKPGLWKHLPIEAGLASSPYHDIDIARRLERVYNGID